MESHSSGFDAAWMYQTYDEVKAAAEQEGSILIVPVGSIEQHGKHLPVGTDTILVDAIAQLGTERVEDDVPVLTTPPIWTGYSPHHMPLGGTVTVDFDHLHSVVEDVADAGLENGFDAVLLLNGHGGNISLIDAAVSTVGDAHPDAEIFGLTYFQLAESFIDEVRESDTGGIAHAGEFETSLMLYIRPELVRDERKGTYWEQEYDRTSEDMFDSGPLAVYRTFDEYSASGAIGDPDLGTAEKGERIYELLGDELEAVLRDIHRGAQS